MNRKRRSKLQAASSPYSKGFNVKRGRDYFLVALLGSFSLFGAIAFVLIVSILAAVIGTFTENVSF